MDFLFDLLSGLIEDLVEMVWQGPTTSRGRGELGSLERELGGTLYGEQVHVMSDGVPVRLGYARRGNKRVAEIEVDLPPDHPFTLRVCPRAKDRRVVAEVRSGNARFDDEFLIGGAPADVVSRFFDAGLRALLARERAAELTTHVGGFLRLTLARRVADAADARKLLQAVARIPLRLRAAYAEAERALAVEAEGGPYRRDPSGAAERDLRASWRDEVDRVIALSRRAAL